MQDALHFTSALTVIRALARREAALYNTKATVAHVVWAILWEGRRSARSRALAEMIDNERLRNAMKMPSGSGMLAADELFSAAGVRAHRQGDDHVGVEHVMRVLVNTEPNWLARIVRDGKDVDAIRKLYA